MHRPHPGFTPGEPGSGNYRGDQQGASAPSGFTPVDRRFDNYNSPAPALHRPHPASRRWTAGLETTTAHHPRSLGPTRLHAGGPPVWQLQQPTTRAPSAPPGFTPVDRRFGNYSPASSTAIFDRSQRPIVLSLRLTASCVPSGENSTARPDAGNGNGICATTFFVFTSATSAA